jgi:hypothetical protein
MRVEAAVDLVDCPSDLVLPRARSGEPRQSALILGGEHATLRKDQAEQRVVGHRTPVDQVLQDVVVDPKGKDQRQEADGVDDVVM